MVPVFVLSHCANISAVGWWKFLRKSSLRLLPVSIPENALTGRSIVRVIAYDEAGYTLSYTITSGNIDSAFQLMSLQAG
jgi:hypothetical protein